MQDVVALRPLWTLVSACLSIHKQCEGLLAFETEHSTCQPEQSIQLSQSDNGIPGYNKMSDHSRGARLGLSVFDIPHRQGSHKASHQDSTQLQDILNPVRDVRDSLIRLTQYPSHSQFCSPANVLH